MKVETELKLLAYADGELPAAEMEEIELLLKENNAAADLLAEFQWSRACISGADCDLKVPESREFYWSKVSRAIELSDRELERTSAGVRQAPWWQRVVMPLAGLAAVALVFNANIGKQGTDGVDMGAAGGSITTASEPVWEDANVYEFYDEKEKMSVIWVTTDGGTESVAPTRENLFRDDEF
jgi:hypothetical protein